VPVRDRAGTRCHTLRSLSPTMSRYKKPASPLKCTCTRKAVTPSACDRASHRSRAVAAVGGDVAQDDWDDFGVNSFLIS